MKRVRIHDMGVFGVTEIKIVVRDHLIEIVTSNGDDDYGTFTLQCFGEGHSRPTITWPPEDKTEPADSAEDEPAF